MDTSNFAAALKGATQVEMDHLFERARAAMDDDGWVPIDAPKESIDLCLEHLELSKEIALLRARYTVNHPIKVATMLAQPEVFFSPDRPAGNEVVECGIEKLIAPGDAIAWAKLQMTPVSMRTTTLTGSPQLGSLSVATLRLRHLLWRDFPRLGCATVVVAPFLPETELMVEELGAIKAHVAVLEPHKDADKTMITEITYLRRVPMWAVPMAFPMHFKKQIESVVDYRDSEEFKQLSEHVGKYIVVGIRRCSKGPPLLPSQNGTIADVTVDTDWVEAEIGRVRFGLPEYLRTFLQRIGTKDIAIFDRLHGRQVVRYQAVIQARQWERAWALLEGPFRIQRAAYRRKHGGSNAPDITMDMDPKFLELHESLLPQAIEATCDEVRMKNWPTERTFIHFGGRCRSSFGHATDLVDGEPAYMDSDFTLPSEYEQARQRF